MALPAQIGTTTIIARLAQLVLADTAVDLSTPADWRIYAEPVGALLPSLPPSGYATAQLLMPPADPHGYTFTAGVANVPLPVVLYTTGTTLSQEWMLTLVQDGATPNDSDDPTSGPFEVPRVWGRWLVTLTPADASNTVELAVRGVPDPTLTAFQTPAWVGLMQAALASYFAAHPAPAGDPGPSAYDVAVKNGFSGTETQWLASLKGAQGDPGEDGGGQEPRPWAWYFGGNLVARTGKAPLTVPPSSIYPGKTFTALAVTARLGTLPGGGADVRCRVAVNGSTVKEIAIPAGTEYVYSALSPTQTFQPYDAVSADVIFVPTGTPVAAGDLVVELWWAWR